MNEHDPHTETLRELTALIPRAEFRLHSTGETVWAGFRRDSACSFYYGTKYVLHFNSAGQLRRAYIDGVLYKAENRQLIAVTRVRQAERTLHQSHLCSPALQATFLQAARERLRNLATALDAGLFDLVDCFPIEADIVTRLRDWLSRRSTISVQLADRPHLG